MHSYLGGGGGGGGLYWCISPFIETPFNTFANREDPDQAALVRAAWSGSTLFAYGNMIRYDPTLVDLTSSFFVLHTIKTWVLPTVFKW